MVRNTWLKGTEIDYAFFLGNGTKSESKDEIVLDAPDDYRRLSRKVWCVFEYAVQNGYDYVFKCDVDTYVHIPRLMKSGFEEHDYLGHYGGSGYWVSQKAMSLLLPLELDWADAEDELVFRNLARLGVSATEERRFNSRTSEGPQEDNDIITAHWYSDRDVKPRERIIRTAERFSLIPKYYEKSKSIKGDR